MIHNFEIDFDGSLFQFNTLNRVKLDAFQVYVNYEGKTKRFHMQLTKEGNFKITDKDACPTAFHHLEETLSDAIKKLGQ